ncbi:UNVERIFIED_CONTAM: hypothetical protein HDU68_006231, partial [Siphonaria sp. JEL0065]
ALVAGALISSFDSTCVAVATSATTTTTTTTQPAPVPSATPTLPTYDPNGHVVITPGMNNGTTVTSAAPAATTSAVPSVADTISASIANTISSAAGTSSAVASTSASSSTTGAQVPSQPANGTTANTVVTTTGAATNAPSNSAATSTSIIQSTTSASVPSANTPYTPPPPVYSETDRNTAIAQCTQVISGEAGCADLTDNRIQFMISACAKDVLAAGNHDFTEGHKRAAHSNCAQIANTIISSPVQNTNSTVAAAAVIVANGYGNNTCPNACSGHGVCGSAGCACVSGFSGVDCSVDLGALVPPKPIEGACSPPVALAQNPIVQVAIQNAVTYPVQAIVNAPSSGSTGNAFPAGNVGSTSGNNMPKPAAATPSTVKPQGNLLSAAPSIG